LHNDHDRRALVVEAVRHRFADEPDRLLALQIALGLDDVVGVVQQDAVAALAGGNASDRGGDRLLGPIEASTSTTLGLFQDVLGQERVSYGDFPIDVGEIA
jgi:hypothetical protein